MRPRPMVIFAVAALLVAACGGSVTSPAPATTQPGGGATPLPAATPGGGGGGGGGGNDNSVQYEISGAVQASGELPFFAAFSRFSGDPAGMHLLYMLDDGVENVAVYEFQGAVLVSYVGEEFAISTPACQLTNYQADASMASGAFDCPDAQVVDADGELLLDTARISGTFSARR